jgi:uncharacterized protein (TIGR02453 family)
MSAAFTPRTLAFLRSLKRHNDRDWFRAHKEEYETHVRAPMLAVIERLALDLPAFAPDLVASRHSMFRIYRDTRFSADKRPLKTHVAASFTSRAVPKGAGAGLYFHVDPNTDKEVWIGGGIYAPEPRELARLREHIAAHHRRLGRILAASSFRRAVGRLEGTQLTRTPRGYAADHPAAAYLRFKQLYAGRAFDIGLATSPRFYAELLRVFRSVAPLVAFLNEPLTSLYREERQDPIADLLGGARRRR